MFPQKLFQSDYYHAVLNHLFNPNEEDYQDPKGWIQDIESLTSYLDQELLEVSKPVFNKLLNLIADESSFNHVKSLIKAYYIAGNHETEKKIINKIQLLSHTYCFSEITSKNILTGFNKQILELKDYQSTIPKVLSKSEKELVCSPVFLHDSSGKFLDAVEQQLSDNSWEEVRLTNDFSLWRKEAEVLVEEKMKMPPANIQNLIIYLELELKEILEKVNPLQRAVIKGDLNQLGNMINTPQHDSSEISRTTLGIAVLSGNLEVVKALVNSQHFDLNEQDSKKFTPVQIASLTGHVPILKFLLESGAKPVMMEMLDTQLISTKLLLDKGAQISVNYLIRHRSSNSLTNRRIQSILHDSLTPAVVKEVVEKLNLRFLSHAWNKKGEVQIQRIDGGEQEMKFNLEGSIPQINCEIMSLTWKAFCQSHHHGIPDGFDAILCDAFKCASESNILESQGLFERYKNNLPTIIPVRFRYSVEEQHCVGVLLWKNYFCIFNGGLGRKNGSLFQGRFKPELITPEIIKEIFTIRDMDSYKEFFYEKLPHLIGLASKNDNFLNKIYDYFGLQAQAVGNCSWYNIDNLVPILLACHMKETSSNDQKTCEIAQDLHNEWKHFQRAWLLRNYLSSESRQDFIVNHDFVKNILESSWYLGLSNISQKTKGILYESERKYLSCLSAHEQMDYKVNKVIRLVKSWQGQTLYPSSTDLLTSKTKRLR